MRFTRVVYWFVAGTLVGVGFAAAPSIGIFLLPVGLVLIVFVAIRRSGGDVWALLVGFGLTPAILIARAIITSPPPCPANGVITTHGGQTVSCSGPIPQLQYYLVGGFALVALVGLAWGVVQWLRIRRQVTA
jgi:hypothetical protein